MNERIKELAEQANAWYPKGYPSGEGGDAAWQNLVIFEKEDLEKFIELIKQAIYDRIKEELIPDDIIAKEQVHHQKYLKGCNSGVVDALCLIKQFGVEE